MSKKTLFPFAAAALAAVLAGCTNVANFDYAGAPGPMVKFPDAGGAKPSIAVLPFLDQRGVKYVDPAQRDLAEDQPAGDRGSFYLGLIPLFPSGFVEKAEPENSDDFVSLGRFHFDPAQDLATASFLSLKTSGLFGPVIRANSLRQATDADYLWQGTVTNTRYRGAMFSYCITYFLAPGLWVIGAPNGVSRNELWVDFALIRRSTGETVWTYSYRSEDYLVHWIYARVGQDASMYPELMKQAMNGALYELSRKLPELNR